MPNHSWRKTANCCLRLKPFCGEITLSVRVKYGRATSSLD